MPEIGGRYVFPVGGVQGDYVQIIRFADLQSRPEFAVLARKNKSITTSDLLAYFIQDVARQSGLTDFTLVNIDRTVNVIDPQTNQTTPTSPAKNAEMTYSDSYGIQNYGDLAILMLSNGGNTGCVLYPRAQQMTAAGEFLPEHQHIFD